MSILSNFIIVTLSWQSIVQDYSSTFSLCYSNFQYIQRFTPHFAPYHIYCRLREGELVRCSSSRLLTSCGGGCRVGGKPGPVIDRSRLQTKRQDKKRFVVLIWISMPLFLHLPSWPRHGHVSEQKRSPWENTSLGTRRRQWMEQLQWQHHSDWS